MLLNKQHMEVPSTTISTTTLATGTTIFKYIVKEKSKNVIVINDSDDEDTTSSNVVNSLVTPSNQQSTSYSIHTKNTNTKKRKRLHQNVHGNVNDPISLDDSDNEYYDIKEEAQDLFMSIERDQEQEQQQAQEEVEGDTYALLSELSEMNTLLISNSPKSDSSPQHLPSSVEQQRQQLEEQQNEKNSLFKNKLNCDIMEVDSLSDVGSDIDLNIGNITSLFSPLTEHTTMSDSELSSLKREDAVDIVDHVMQYTALLQPPPTIVNTILSDDNLSLLRFIELYIQSVTDIPIIPTEARVSRRTTRHVDNNHEAPIEPINPYVPNRVWYNSTWEDWAQLDVGDVLHCPFTREETTVLETQVAKQHAKKSKFGRELVDFWQYVSTFLPGRTPLDCKCFWQDYTEGNNHLHSKSIIIARQKNEQRNRSRHQMILKRSRMGIMNYNSMKTLHLANMSRESIISEGSGDAITLAIFNDAVNGVRIAVGSLCDENMQYNMPGNLRLWSSDTENCLSLRGHKTPNEESGQDIWRTVTDVKMSKDQSLIYSASHDGCANIWKASTGKLVSTLQYHCKPINQMAVNYSAVSNNVLATCSNDGTATIWTVSSNGKTGSGMICELDTRFYSDPRVDCIEFGHHATEDMLFLGINNKDIDHPGYIEVFDATKGESKIRFDSMKGCVSTLAVSTSGRYILSGNYNRYDNMSGDRYLHLHDIRSPKSVTKFYSGHPDVNIVAISPCERYVASGNADKEKGEVLIFDVRNSRKVLHTLSHDQTLVDQSLIAPDSSIGIGGLYWTSDSRTILTGGGDSTVKVWGIEGATKLLRSYQTSNCVTSLIVHEETMTIAAGVAGAQGIVHVWQP